MKYKKLLLCLLVAVVVLIFTVGIPYFQFRQFVSADFGGSNTLPYMKTVIEELGSTPSTNLFKLVSNFNDILLKSKASYLNMYLYIEIVLVVALVIIGILLLKSTKNRALAITLFCCSVISILSYIFIYLILIH